MNRERQIRHGINRTPFSAASVATQWKLERDEKLWTRIICFRNGLSEIQAVIIDFLQEDWFFPHVFGQATFHYRLTSKMRLNYAIPNRATRENLADVNRFELDPWI
jgi:hypothetical protein